ncbi:MAG: PotD/PotF family extracellular solute-binding protein [Gaiellales bacterium]|jgi:spermidine/putrescine transport system substrate-binding protein|nr:spermidine/putrescine ABC transporter substrate-binding protein [Gaiellales bacterium]
MNSNQRDPIRIALSRRQLLRRAAQLGVGVPAAGWLLAACGGSSASSSGGTTGGAASAPAKVEGTAILHNYAGWMGKDNIKHFRAQYPGANIKQVTAGDISSSATAQTLKANPDAYDFALGDQAFVGQALAADIIQDVDFDKVPNIANVDAKFHEAFSHGVPTDYGKVGIGYRKDMVSEPIASWADLWSLAPKYSGKIVFLDFDRDTIGSALRYKGFSGNTQDESELEQAKQALIDIKPHLLAIKGYDVAASLVKGDAAIVMDWDYDVALGQGQDPNIEWVLPEEGAMAYLEGWSVIKGTDNVDLVHAFMNFFLQPKEYADFVNTTGTAYVMDAATPYINASISENSALIVDPATLEKVEFENFLGEATALYSKAWDEFKSA